MKLNTGRLRLATFALAFLATTAVAQTIKIGVINTYSGPFASLGDLIDKSINLYIKQNEGKLPAGVKVEFVNRDDTGPIPDVAKRLAQELILRDKVQFITGMIWTPNTAAIAPLVTEAKVPMVLMNAAGSVLTTLSPYIVRMSMTLWQSSYPLGQWAAKKYKRAYILVTDFAPGHDAEAAFTKGFKDNGGEIVGSVRMPIKSPDFVAYMQRAKDSKPEVIFSMVPTGSPATAIMKAYGDLGLKQAGIPLVTTGDITTEEELPNMGDLPLGVISAMHYSVAGDRPANKAYVSAWKSAYGENSTPSFIAVGAWDAMDAIFAAIRAQNGKMDPDKTMQFLANWKSANSPRGPLAIDPQTRDIVQNEYIREVRKVSGKLANVEIETIPNVKDPWKEFNKK